MNKKNVKASQGLQKVFSLLSDHQVFTDHAIFGAWLAAILKKDNQNLK